MILSNKDPKRMAALIVKMGPTIGKVEKEVEEKSEGPSSMDEGQMAAAEEAVAAIKAGDAKAFAEAMKSFVEMCSGDYKEPMGEVEEEA